MSRLKDIAKKTVTANNIMAGKEKISIDDIISFYPNGISINGVNMISYKGNTYPVFTFSEDNGKFFSGGSALTKIVEEWTEQYAGDMTAINADLQAENVKIKMEKVRTSTGRTFVKVDIIDD